MKYSLTCDSLSGERKLMRKTMGPATE